MKNIKLYPCFKHWLEYDSIWIISDTHFDDVDCKYMDSNWITPEEHIQKLKKVLNKRTLLIHLGDVGNPKYLQELKGYKVLIQGNHDHLSELKPYFNEIYTGPLFIAQKILLSHEPIKQLSWCVNIHGHNHNKQDINEYDPFHVNLAANICGYTPLNLATFIKNGGISDKFIPNIHRFTIDNIEKT